jgi:hypothetical protein
MFLSEMTPAVIILSNILYYLFCQQVDSEDYQFNLDDNRDIGMHEFDTYDWHFVGHQMAKFKDYYDTLTMYTNFEASKAKLDHARIVYFWTEFEFHREDCEDVRNSTKQQACASEAIKGWLLDFATAEKQTQRLQQAISAQMAYAEATKETPGKDIYWSFSETVSATAALGTEQFTTQACGGAPGLVSVKREAFWMQRVTTVYDEKKQRTYYRPASILAHMPAWGLTASDPTGVVSISYRRAQLRIKGPGKVEEFKQAVNPKFMRKYGVNVRKFQITIHLPISLIPSGGMTGEFTAADLTMAVNIGMPVLDAIVAFSTELQKRTRPKNEFVHLKVEIPREQESFRDRSLSSILGGDRVHQNKPFIEKELAASGSRLAFRDNPDERKHFYIKRESVSEESPKEDEEVDGEATERFQFKFDDDAIYYSVLPGCRPDDIFTLKQVRFPTNVVRNYLFMLGPREGFVGFIPETQLIRTIEIPEWELHETEEGRTKFMDAIYIDMGDDTSVDDENEVDQQEKANKENRKESGWIAMCKSVKKVLSDSLTASNVVASAAVLAADQLGLALVKTSASISFTARVPLDATAPTQLSVSMAAKTKASTATLVTKLLDVLFGWIVPTGDIVVSKGVVVDITGLLLLERCIKATSGRQYATNYLQLGDATELPAKNTTLSVMARGGMQQLEVTNRAVSTFKHNHT